ncbi:hypothetical protein DL764_006254 [Monosporascus ibericus]|uniref:Piwi domain-containing protein n=1 Tax=Monosporascus ibericus TaxID=155417 RepID=A0A4Q4T7S0_9PEZI|nr:hypothetical protein DL764_006254 [Monosporascus ibericus]
MAGNPYSIGGKDPLDPDQNVRRAEDAMEKRATSLESNGAANRNTFPLRPGYGKAGSRKDGSAVKLWANYVDMNINDKNLRLYRYAIAVEPSAVGKKLERIVWLLLHATKLSQHKGDIVSDFKATLISRKDLGELAKYTYNVPYFSELEDTPSEAAKRYNVRLDLQYALPISDLGRYMTSQDSTKAYPRKLEMIQSLNIFLNHYTKVTKSLISVGSNRTFPLSADTDNMRELGVGIRALKGFFASARIATNRLLVNVNVSHSAFFKSIPLTELLRLFKDRFLKDNPRKGDEMLFALHYFLEGISIRTTHRRQNGGPNEEIKTISGLATQGDGKDLDKQPGIPAQFLPKVEKLGANSQSVSFWMDPKPDITQSKRSSVEPGGRHITVFEYFQTNYKNTVLDKSPLPVVNVGSQKRPVYLPPEVCQVIGGQRASSKLDEEQRQMMTKFSIRLPKINAESIVSKGLETVGLNPNCNPKIRDWGFSASPRLITVEGRQLSQPAIRYNQSTVQVKDGASWNLLKRRFRAAGTLPTWSYLVLFPKPNKEELSMIMKEFGRTLREMGILVPEPVNATIFAPEDVNIMAAKVDQFFRSLDKPGVKLIFTILPSSNSPYYNIVKRLGDVQHGVTTICMDVKKLKAAKGRDQYLRNISMKVNLKLGGNNHLVEPARLALLNQKRTMIVGVDVTHPSPGSAPSAPSIAAMVANNDEDLAQWPAALNLQAEARQEMVTGLSSMLESRLRLWCAKKTKALPENILVYRDGVSEGQYKIVIDEELPQLRQACRKAYGQKYKEGHCPRISIIIVGKRHHTRFYPTEAANADKNGNTKPGTVVDRGVTEGQNWDFFLQPHGAIIGTVRPAHYFVVLDEIFRSEYGQERPVRYKNVQDALEDVTQSLCYMFGRATRAVSICTPAYYADLACERARRYFDYLYLPAVMAAALTLKEKNSSVERPDKFPVAFGSDVRIHPRLADSMFYI